MIIVQGIVFSWGHKFNTAEFRRLQLPQPDELALPLSPAVCGQVGFGSPDLAGYLVLGYSVRVFENSLYFFICKCLYLFCTYLIQYIIY